MSKTVKGFSKFTKEEKIEWLASFENSLTQGRNAAVSKAVLVILLFSVVFCHAWVCDDAYISFRSVEQLFLGRGPVPCVCVALTSSTSFRGAVPSAGSFFTG